MTAVAPRQVGVLLDYETWLMFHTWIQSQGRQMVIEPARGTYPSHWTIAPTYRSDGGLTKRELQVLIGIAQGKTNIQIAADLYLSTDTVKTHTRKLFRRLEVDDRSAAVHKAHVMGILGGRDE